MTVIFNVITKIGKSFTRVDLRPTMVRKQVLLIFGFFPVPNPVYPAPVQLYWVDLPWVTHATHLGHELHKDFTMGMDTRIRRANYIQKSGDIRHVFSFALPT